MQFRLTYQGPLLSPTKDGEPRATHKHEIRRHLHPQIRRFWSFHPSLQELRKRTWEGSPLVANPGEKSAFDILTDRYTRPNGFRFVPLVREELHLLCSLEILFLRPAKPGSLVASGDIDNRLKTFLDALRVPTGGKEFAGQRPTEDEHPFFVLLEDDKLITRVVVETDYLLRGVHPERSRPDENDAFVLLTVRLQPYVARLGGGVGNMGFL